MYIIYTFRLRNRIRRSSNACSPKKLASNNIPVRGLKEVYAKKKRPGISWGFAAWRPRYHDPDILISRQDILRLLFPPRRRDVWAFRIFSSVIYAVKKNVFFLWRPRSSHYFLEEGYKIGENVNGVTGVLSEMYPSTWNRYNECIGLERDAWTNLCTILHICVYTHNV